MQFNTNEEENHEQTIASKHTKQSKKSKASNNNNNSTNKAKIGDALSTASIIVDEIESNSCSSSSSYRNSSTSSSKHTGDLLNSNTNSIVLSSVLSDTNSSTRCSFFHKPSGTIMIDSNYDSLSMTTNMFDFYQQNDATSSSSVMNDGGGVFASSQRENPFLNKSLTNLISFNSDMSLLDSHFETSLHLIDGKLFGFKKQKLEKSVRIVNI